MYLLQSSIEDRVPSNVSTTEIEATTLRFHLLGNIFIALSWTVVVAIKYSFLFLFRTLIRRVRVMEIYWRCVMSVTTITWIAGGWELSLLVHTLVIGLGHMRTRGR